MLLSANIKIASTKNKSTRTMCKASCLRKINLHSFYKTNSRIEQGSTSKTCMGKGKHTCKMGGVKPISKVGLSGPCLSR